MYREEELLKKVNGHLKENDIKLLKSLISDLDEFNEKYGNGSVEIYIDFDDVGNYSEFDPYETFSIKLHNIKFKDVPHEKVHDYLNIHQLDDCLCAIELYHEKLLMMLNHF